MRDLAKGDRELLKAVYMQKFWISTITITHVSLKPWQGS